MSTYPGSSRLLKGAIVAVNDNMQPPNVIAFRYNPEGVRRSLQPQTAGGGQGERSQLVRYIGAPVETFDLEIHIEGVDELVGDQTTIQYGIHPQLAALEMLVYPGSQQVIQNDALLSSGILEIAPIAAPLTRPAHAIDRALGQRRAIYAEPESDPGHGLAEYARAQLFRSRARHQRLQPLPGLSTF
jgi:hypothetical protein